MRQGYVYILGNNKPVLYIGVTSNLLKRLYQHRQGLVRGFSNKYSTHKLLYYEVYDSVVDAIKREKQLKNWHREWKLNLITKNNPDLRDLSEEVL